MDKSFKIKRFIIELISVVILTSVDRYTKGLAVSRLKDRDALELIKGWLELYYLPNGNTGAAFGMLKGHQVLFCIIALAVCIVLFILLYNMPPDRRFIILDILLVFIIAGGFGNMYDRLMQGYVVDFIYISRINFPIFNVADIYVSCSTFLLAVLLLFYYKEGDIKLIESAIKAALKKDRDGQD